MLFLLRPPQTYLPYWLPRDPASRAVRDRQLQKAYSSTRRVPPAAPSPDPAAPGDLVRALRDLGALHQSGALSQEEFQAAKAKLLNGTDAG